MAQSKRVTPLSAYTMVKARLHAITQQIAIELAVNNIRVNVVSPAIVNTPIYESFLEHAKCMQRLPHLMTFTRVKCYHLDFRVVCFCINCVKRVIKYSLLTLHLTSLT